MTLITASDLVRHCRYERVLKRAKPRSANLERAGARGTVFHRGVESWRNTGQLPVVEDLELQGWLDCLATQWRPQPGMELEVALGLSPEGAYVPVQEMPPGSHCYVPTLEAGGIKTRLLVAGRADAVWWETETTLRICDWKTGAWPPEHPRTNLQLWALAIAAARRAQLSYDVPFVQPGLYLARSGVFDWADPVRVDSDEWIARFADVEAAALLDERPHPGPWCGSCWERKTCEHSEAA